MVDQASPDALLSAALFARVESHRDHLEARQVSLASIHLLVGGSIAVRGPCRARWVRLEIQNQFHVITYARLKDMLGDKTARVHSGTKVMDYLMPGILALPSGKLMQLR